MCNNFLVYNILKRVVLHSASSSFQGNAVFRHDQWCFVGLNCGNTYACIHLFNLPCPLLGKLLACMSIAEKIILSSLPPAPNSLISLWKISLYL